MDINCKGFVGHRWSTLKPGPGFSTWCTRCHVLFKPKPPKVVKPEPTSILNGKPIPDNLVVGQEPVLEYNLGGFGLVPVKAEGSIVDFEPLVPVTGIWDANTLSSASAS